MNKDYREVYKNVIGACASCKYIRSKEPGLQGDYIEYDGSRRGYCVGNGIDFDAIATVYMHDTPDMEKPICPHWEEAPNA